MSEFVTRVTAHTQLSTYLSSLSDELLAELLDKASPLHSGIGGKSLLLDIAGRSIFVKKVPLTDLERRPENSRSTANIFDLPLYYQYGVGSTGFGAWRELESHLMTTQWVISGACPNFPLLYHWRALPSSQPDPMNDQERQRLQKDIFYWNQSQTIGKRLEAIHDASANIVLFIEYIPQTLQQWLKDQLHAGGDEAASGVAFVDEQLTHTHEFMKRQGFLHMDAHFHNILTDGERLYFSDFGLALSSKFDLSNEEIEFFVHHQNYDQCSTIVNFIHTILTTHIGKDPCWLWLQDYLKNEGIDVEPYLVPLFKKYGPISLVMDDFYGDLQKKSKLTPYPSTHLEQLIHEMKMALSD